MTKFLILPFILVGCTAPITDPPAHACSLPLDGSPANCPDTLDDAIKLPREELRGDLDVLDVHQWNDIHHMFMRNQRRQEVEKTMTQPEDAINNALLEFNNGSNDTTKQKELLQLQSDSNHEGT
jgi:hypothetical protein